MIGHLIQPLGVLSLMTVANGILANIQNRSDWSDIQVPIDEVKKVQASDVIALVNRIQNNSVHAIDSLGQVLATSPVMASSAAAAIFLSVLMRRKQTRRVEDDHQPAGGFN